MDPDRPPRFARTRGVLRGALVVLPPWAFGSVEAWAGLILAGLVVVLAGLSVFAGGRRKPGGPALALAGLALLGVVQALPMGEAVVSRLAPGSASLIRSMAPRSPQGVVGAEGSGVSPPSMSVSLEPESSRKAAVSLAVAALAFWASSVPTGRRDLARLGLLLALNCAVLAVFARVQALSWDGRIFWARPSPMEDGRDTGGPFVGHGPLAAYLCLGLGFALAGLRAGRRPGPGRAVWAYLAFAIGAGLIGSHSRTGVLAAVGASVVVAAEMGVRGRWIAAGVIGFGLLVIVVTCVDGSTSSLLRLTSLADNGSLAPRLEIARAAVRAWADRPVFGSGFGTFSTVAAPYLTSDDGRFVARAENEWLDLLTEGGLVGVGIALAGLASLTRAIRQTGKSWDVAAAAFGLVALAIHALGDSPLHVPGVAIPAAVLAGVAWGGGQKGRSGCSMEDHSGADPDSPRSHEEHEGRHKEMGEFPSSLCLPSCSSWLRGEFLGVFHFGAFVAVAGLAVLILRSKACDAMAEVELARGGLPLPGSAMPSAGPDDSPRSVLETRRHALIRALAHRPDWAEGHLRLALTATALYRRTVLEWIAEDGAEGPSTEDLGDPLALRRAVLAGSPEMMAADPVRDHLVPAARSFLEARRCSPAMAWPHLGLATVDFLLIGPDSSGDHLGRTLARASPDGAWLERVAEVARQSGRADLERRALERARSVRDDRDREARP